MVTGRKCGVVAALAALVLGVAGCGSGGGTAPPSGTSASAAMPMDTTGASTTTGASATTASSGASTSPSAGAAITIKNFAYGPTLEVAAGSNVTVTNTDSAAHTVTADQGGAFDVTVKGSGGTATFTAPGTPGTYTYHCTFHPNMHGTLVVK